jgi:hypothetical protein
MKQLYADPEKGLLKNLTTGENKLFIINPSEITTSLKAIYKIKNVLGMGNNKMVYEKTENMPFKFSLHLHSSQIENHQKIDADKAQEVIKDWNKFLSAMLFPVKIENKGWLGGEPPKVWFSYPKLVSMPGRITSIDWAFKRFPVKGGIIYQIASLMKLEKQDGSLVHNGKI